MSDTSLSKTDSDFLSYLRSFSIFIIVFGHVGLFWVFSPYTQFLHVFVPIFFFLSGAVSYISFQRSPTISSYYLKRIVGLLVPYYLLCILAIVFYVGLYGSIPEFDLSKFIRWLEIRPNNSIMPFPVGQVWFLHTLLIISILSPLFFLLVHNSYGLLILITALMALSGLQLIYDIDENFLIYGNNFYKPLIHSIFYIMGILFISSSAFRSVKLLWLLVVSGVFLSVLLAHYLNLNPSYLEHTFAPNIYYVLGSLAAIALTIICKSLAVDLINRAGRIKLIFDFFHKHTFSIFLLHSLAIYIAEVNFGLVNPDSNVIVYGIMKLVLVLLITCALAVPFTKLSVLISKFILALSAGAFSAKKLKSST